MAGEHYYGVEDVNAQEWSACPPNNRRSYTVNADGRGTLTLQLGQNSIDFGIVLLDKRWPDDRETSNSSQSSTGSGNSSNKRVRSVFGNYGPYVFDFALDGSGNPESFVGSSGEQRAASAGFFDDNDNGTFSSGLCGTIAQIDSK